MKAKLFITAFLMNFILQGQDSFIIGDATNFDITMFSDTVEYSSNTGPGLLPIDIDQDGEYDFTIRLYREFDSQIPSWERHIFLDNHGGEQIEILSSFHGINLYSENDIAEVKNDTIWESLESFRIHYSSDNIGWWGGNHWQDIFDPNNIYCTFKKSLGTESHYGWLKFSATPNQPTLILHETAISKTNTTTNIDPLDKQVEINIFPNPTTQIINIKLNNLDHQNLEWELFDLSSGTITNGLLTGENTKINTSTFNVNHGMFILQIKRQGLLISTKKIVLQ